MPPFLGIALDLHRGLVKSGIAAHVGAKSR